MKEYGGYLPLELRHAEEYYSCGDDKIIKTNSGLTSIFCALKKIEPQRVFLPYFICPTVDNLVSSLGYEIVRYHINNRFEPIEITCSDDDCIVLVNYFGINAQTVNRYYHEYKNVIIDNTQAFFSPPIMKKGVYNCYSCRKFIGVPDGGYLIGNDLPDIDLEQDHSSDRSLFLLKQYEDGINGAYKDSLENYRQFAHDRKRMSGLTERLLGSVDYDSIINKRRANFWALNQYLSVLNELNTTLNSNDVPYSYPFMIGKNIRDKLIENKIFVPYIWKEKLDKGLNPEEHNFTQNIYHLPIDQRYNANDMECISQTVLKLLKGK